MKLLDWLRFRIATLFYRSQINADVEEELRSHIQHRADDLERAGLLRAEAERRARIEFGAHGKFKEECHDALGSAFLETFLQDEHGPNSAPYLVLSHAYWHSRFQDDPNIVGRVVELNKHRFTILGVAPREFQGTLLFYFPDFWAPVVNREQLEGENILNARGDRNFIMTFGHLKPGVTPAQAISDLNAIGAWLEKSYPKDDAKMTFTLGRPSLTGDLIGPAVRGFIAGLTLLAG